MGLIVHPVLLDAIKVIGAKRTMLQELDGPLDTLVIGSSHGDFGFNPAFCPGSFNFCCTSQDLRHSFLIHRRLSQQYPTLRHVVLYYSLFSPGNILERSPTEKYYSAALNELLDLGLDYQDPELQLEYGKIRNQLGHITVTSQGIRGFLPTEAKGFFPASYGAQRRADDHLKLARRPTELIHLVRLLLLARHLGQRVCIVVPPVRSDYKVATGGDFRSLFGTLLEVLHDFHLDCEVSLVNGFDSDLFCDDDFGDYDHLRPLGRGTECLSGLIRRQRDAVPPVAG